MTEKTATELFNEEIEHNGEVNKAHDKLDEVEREIVHLRNQIDELRTKIRNLEDEGRGWKKVIRTQRHLANKANKEAWSAKQSGI